ncbi:MAG: hypothetical protein Q8M16_19565 [Pirellulaceae bacterium]|nr:hypothetical protein [Pirellulaceae bacterium]
MPKKLPPRITLRGEVPDFLRPVNSLRELAIALDVSLYKLRSWREVCPPLKNGRPYSIGKVAFQLIATKRFPRDLQSCSKELQFAIASEVAIDAAEQQKINEIIDAMQDCPDAVDSILYEDDPKKLTVALKQLGALKPKSWIPLSQSETVAVSVASPKTASLFFDRVWCMDSRAPSDIGVRFNSLEEKMCLGLTSSLVQSLAEATDATEEKLLEVEQKMMSVEFEAKFASMFESAILSPVKRLTGRDIPIFSSSSAASREVFPVGDKAAVLAIVDNVPLIDEKKLTWDQVIELRKDADAQKKLRRFLHWLEKDYANRPIQFIREAIELKLSEYNDALEKHGIEKSLGRTSMMLDGGFWMALLLSWNEFAGLAGISIMGTRLVLEHYRYQRSRRELNDQNPAAYIYEVRSRIR